MRPYLAIADFPAVLAVFPLTGALLLPRGQLPLNVFEPRYLTMVDAAMSGSRLIGMIQTREAENVALKPRLSAVGCTGRITSYVETDDGRYLVTLTGICRFRVAEELGIATPFRQVKPDYAPFAGDLVSMPESDFPRERLLDALRQYLSQRDLKADWRSVMSAPARAFTSAVGRISRAGKIVTVGHSTVER